MLSLQDLNLSEIEAFVAESGFPKFRVGQIYDLSNRFKEYSEATNLPKDLLAKLAENYRATSLSVVAGVEGRDGAKKYLYRMEDGNIVEGVYMPHGYGDTLCVSTQVGCRMGCAFCASGIGGLVRNLTAGEMLGQVLVANRLNGGTPEKRAVTNVVLMGSGEPLDNFDNVISFLKLITDPRGINISPRNISLSTSGLTDKIRLLADSGITVTLTISLHASTDEKRQKLMPINARHGIADVIAAARYYFEKTGRRIIFEYALIKGTNSDRESAEELSALLKGMPCLINLINLNPVKEKGLSGASKQTVADFLDILKKNGINATLRRSLGQDIEGACGQLRRKFMENSEVTD